LEFAAQYVAEGWHVYAACRHPDSAEQLQRLAQIAKGQIDILAMDVTYGLSIARAAAAIPNAAIIFSSTTPVSPSSGPRQLEPLITLRGRRCSMSTRWAPFGFSKPS